ncbi:MAG TPA: autotransporter domain-containing protein [Devosia sp.]|jgi:autotransporter-associated beta strand protein|uniref:autotransporter outer membrane beta-barrel domain-containing protein n=1 Tax=Devosia sp. TaxID=1871048 RepID=UPI002F94E2E4
MPTTRLFGQASRVKRNRHRAALLLGASLATILILVPAKAGTITYANGEIRSTPIFLDEEYALVSAGNAFQSGLISGSGGIVKQGAGVLSISGNNTFTGGTIIEEGTVSMHHGSALGTGSITLRNASRLVMSYGRSTTVTNDLVLEGTGSVTSVSSTDYTGEISGAGALRLDSGTLRLLAVNSYLGDTYIGANLVGGSSYSAKIYALNSGAFGSGVIHFGGAGSLELGDGVTISNDIVLAAGSGGNGIDATGVATLSGDITGAGAGGRFSHQAGELILTGKSDYSARTYVHGGTLTGGALNAFSNASLYAVEEGGTLKILADQEIGGLTDGGSSYNAGTLDLSGRRLTSLQDSSTTFGGKFLGGENSRLLLGGAGTLYLTGANSDFDGSLVTSTGRFEIDGDFSNATAIISGGELGGSGHIGYVSLNRGGKLIGISGQTLTLDRLVMNSGGVLSASFGLADNAPLFHVLGSVELDGTIEITDAGGFGPGVYRLMTYGGTLFNQEAEFGDLPEGVSADDLELQLLDGQVNIISSADAQGGVTFWDGGDSSKWNNGRIDGGDGSWGDAETFTTADGSSNGPLNPAPGFVVFDGEAGEVTVEAEGTGVTGIQFATDGYVLGGSYIQLGQGERLFRVGDGTSAGAGYVATINNALSGEGRLIKTDAGRLVLNSGENDYTGGTEVRDGVLEVNGIVRDVDVAAGGELTGSGSVASAEVAGTIGARGFDTLRIWNDLAMADGAIFKLAVDAEGNNGLVEVDGTAFLDGDVQVLASGGDYADGTVYTFLRAEGGIEGSFDGVVEDLAFLTAALDYDDNNARLVLTRNADGFASAGATPNQRATAAAIEAGGAGTDLYDRVLTYNLADAQHAFDQLSGEIYATSQNAVLEAQQATTEIIADQLQSGFSRLDAPSLNEPETSIWTSGQARSGIVRGDGNAADAGFSAGNFFVGADRVFNGNWIFGAMGGIGQSHVSAPDRASTARVDNFEAGLYGGGLVGNTSMKFGSSVGVNQTTVERDVIIPGLADHLSGSRSGAALRAFGEVGHRFTFDSGLIVEPYVNLAHTSLFSGSYDEAGGAAALNGESAYAALTTLTLGLRGEHSFTLGNVEAKASGGLGWRQPIGSIPTTASHAFDGGPSFTVTGGSARAGAAVLEAGLDLQLTDALDLGVRYDGQFGADVQQQAVKASLTLKF